MTTLGKYTLHQPLGRGGYGTVYLADDTVLKVQRAVKLLHPALVADPTFIERFRHEAQVAARLEHPHIVPVYELAEDQGRYYLAMKYLPGGSLKDLLAKEGRLPYERALQITRQIASALDFAHQQGLVHRDVKPGNILFEKDGTARLADFGFSKAMYGSSSASLSATGGMIGTPQYMAPELWSGKPATPATDVYSLACVLCEMLSGEMLFGGESPAEIMKRHVLDGPQLPKEWPGNVPQGFEEVLRKALAMRVDERYSAAGTFIGELEKLEKVKPKHSEAFSDAHSEPTASLEKSKESKEGKSVQPIKSVATPKPGFEAGQHLPPQQEKAVTRKVSDFVGQQAGDYKGEFKQEDLSPVKSHLPAAALKGEAGVREQSKTKYLMIGGLRLVGLIGIVGIAAILIFMLTNLTTQKQMVSSTQVINTIAANIQHEATHTSLPTITQTRTPTATQTITPEPTNTIGPTIFNGSTPPTSASLGDLWLSSVDGMLLAYIPSGEFQMGNEYGEEDEKPVHTVYLDAYWMDTTEVTNEMFAQFLNEMGNQVEYAQDWYVEKYIKKVDNDWQVLAGYEDHPVINANWFGARAYCEWAGRKLPSEAEWEKAARGGDEGNTYPWGNQEPSCQLGAINGANYEGCGLEDTTQVASFSSNGYGLFDIAGNVYEYVMDKYSKFYYTVSPQENPKGPDSGSIVIIRGGAFSSQASNLNVASRVDVYSGYIPMPVGFRCVFSP